jgi:hypothetical protein
MSMGHGYGACAGVVMGAWVWGMCWGCDGGIGMGHVKRIVLAYSYAEGGTYSYAEGGGTSKKTACGTFWLNNFNNIANMKYIRIYMLLIISYVSKT